MSILLYCIQYLQNERMTVMKRSVILLLTLCLLLCGCNSAGKTPSATDDTPAPGNTTETTVETTDSTENTEPPVLYRHPLTGAPLTTPYAGRPTSVVINNIKACLPQFGIASADMIYEFETEGGITRLLAIFSDLTDVGNIGPVRSARTYFSNISAAYDIPLVHCGGSVNGLKGYYDLTHPLKKWEHIDQFYNGSYFFRDKERRKNGYALEHTLFTSGELLTKVLAKKGYDQPTANNGDYGLLFEDAPVMDGETANKIVVTFNGKKTTTMTFDATSGLYKAAQYKKDHIDAATGETMSYRNVFVLLSKQTRANDGYYTRSYYDLIGEGDGYFACDGKIVPIKWSRSSVTEPFAYTLTDGTPVTLGVGTSYFGVVNIKAPAGVSYE